MPKNTSSQKLETIRINIGLQSTYFAAALEESPSASMMKWDAERGAVVVDGVDAADFRLIWDYLVRGRAPLLALFFLAFILTFAY